MTDIPLLIVGLGNPGAEHERDRHNVGYWLAEMLAGGGFSGDQKLLGDVCQVSLNHRKVRLLKPTTFMNRSGQSMRQTIDYFKLSPERALVIHDDLDLPPGTARLKMGGGHGGHNGLRDIIAHCGREFLRLRIGIGHPGRKEQVSGRDELTLIMNSLDEARRAIDMLYIDGLEAAMKYLHTASPPQDVTQDLGPAG
jgi:PTH1 family peptidyl-tRNA hydrolase